ncbi:uncharacterized protein LOC122506479 [Leptopilina heterotoma]|uniref:uncharacterized protein LOC122506479 n=1 Tax=Leptopilina heterotoma TaxID=63436 RepID=UPI001CA90C63|nr:uncharacterized protein LOC122506479 [Leptopilina heterotoma]XP_043474626.1 uncharacterized protein LOC122506479 [Leptopilina heterotoma]
MRTIVVIFCLMGIALSSTFAQYQQNSLPYLNPGVPTTQYYGNQPQNYQQGQPAVGSFNTNSQSYPPNIVPNLAGSSGPVVTPESLGFSNIKHEDIMAVINNARNPNSANSQASLENQVTGLMGNMTKEQQDGLGMIISFFNNLGLKDKYENLKQTAVRSNNTFLQGIFSFIEGLVQTALRVLSVLTLGVSDRIMNALHKILFSH